MGSIAVRRFASCKGCPTNFTEQYYFDHPDDNKTHPPAFLGQMSTQDETADLCARKNYYDTLVAHGVETELVLIDPAYEKCYCIGDPNDPAAAGSPYAHYRNDDMAWMCATHTMGFAQMVLPVTAFVLKAFGTSTAS